MRPERVNKWLDCMIYMTMMIMIARFVFIAVCLMKFWCKITEDGDNAEMCMS